MSPRRLPLPRTLPSLPLGAAARERSRLLAEARAIDPDLPRSADAAAVVRSARRLARRAAQDEYARDGVRHVTLPPDFGRAELRRADIPGDAEFQLFTQDVIGALDIAPSTLEVDDARALLRSATSRDGYGLGPEAAADLVSYLLSRAWALQEAELAERGAPAARSEEEFVAQEAATIREEVREALVRLVRTPLELQIARRRHEEIEAGRSDPAPAAEREGRPGQRADAGTAGAAGTAGTSGSDGAKVPLDAAWRFANSETGRRAFGAANDFYRSEAGQKVFHAAKDGAGKLRKAYDRRGDRG
ncbi:hypothetical protein NLU66_01185 [Brachybacterium sp. NBEC-018]|uniref:hypothetical protein n=1 Tax=Brachybacterium sp. NBEC-018 TaxID=2996004 RepID=UPI002174E780|nr:hypothetical protein [Brachybacterium sp. NBEC-018]UVY84239.1 hypothetical protein NLU66_01185 [Brachybacterium sp. NBEC-018]